jgi:hypothetical protein
MAYTPSMDTLSKIHESEKTANVWWLAIDGQESAMWLKVPAGKSPRGALLKALARKSARNRPDGTACHVGWVVAGRWFNVYRLSPLEI